MSLKTRIAERIRTGGPMSVAEYMALALLDPTDGYYPTRDPLGADADFITAPEISQMFGEVLGLWVLQSWRDMGAPPHLALVELGPGKGTLMSDMLRSVRLDPALGRAVSVHLVEASPALEAVQGRTLAALPCPVLWHSSLDAVPPAPSLIVGNEFLDCLPVRQFVRRGASWRERGVTLAGGELAFAESTTGPVAANVPELTTASDASEGELLEVRPATAQLLAQLAARFEAHPGRALFIDYGPAETEFGDTLQAIRGHEKVDPLEAPGEADLTARVDFGALAREARAEGLDVAGPVSQAALLSRLGIEVRAATLARANPSSKDVLFRQLARLTGDEASEGMGQLFKAICLSAAGLPGPLGFATGSDT